MNFWRKCRLIEDGIPNVTEIAIQDERIEEHSSIGVVEGEDKLTS